MDKKSKPKGKKKFPKGSQHRGYTATSPAICLVVHDLDTKREISDKISQEILDLVTEKAIEYGYVVNYTRQ